MLDIDLRPFIYIGIVATFYVVVILVYKFCCFIRVYVFRTYPDFFKYGTWSVITGATDGIGKAIALQLAERGQNIVLIARNKDKLQKVSAEIETTYEVETLSLQIDFGHDESIYDKIDELLKDLNIGVLVNNVGIAPAPGLFWETQNISKTLLALTRINIFSVYKMNQIVLPGMLQRGKGLIINLAAAASIRPTCYFAAYGASKAFCDYFSQALGDECSGKSITIQSVLPFAVSTNMTDNLDTNFLVVSPKKFAASLLSTVHKERQTHGCWQHAIQGWFYRNVPGPLLKFAMKKLVHDMRPRLLAREQEN